jgi:AcrR family transcriptional regulator
MGRRSDHTREELEALILAEGHRLMAEVGYARFSAREVAKRIGYSVGTIFNVFTNQDRLVMAINSHTFLLWAEHLKRALADGGEDRIAALVRGYFSFAAAHPHLWTAIYDHRIPVTAERPERYVRQRAALTDIVREEIGRALPAGRKSLAPALARSLVATVHGHCEFAISGAFALMGETDPQGAALARVRETLAAASA